MTLDYQLLITIYILLHLMYRIPLTICIASVDNIPKRLVFVSTGIQNMDNILKLMHNEFFVGYVIYIERIEKVVVQISKPSLRLD